MQFDILKKSTCAGIVLYNPNILKLKKNIDSLLDQVDKIICIDNASNNSDAINTLLMSYQNIVLIKNQSNAGIAFALNQVFNYANINGYDWYLTMDQDSLCSETMISEYAKHMPLDVDLAVVSPYILNNCKITLDEYKKIELPNLQEIVEPIDCITSGTLNKVSAVKKIGGYNSNLFIDCVDVNYNLQLMLLHQKIYRINTTYMFQEMGEANPVRVIQLLYNITGKNVFRKLRYTPVYSDLRLYYIARNSKYIYYKYGNLAGKRMKPNWLKYQFAYYLLTYPINRNRISMIKSIRKGQRDSNGFEK
jgi:rhamnosyltransferase